LTVTSADPDGAVAASAQLCTDLNIAVARSDPNVSLPDPGDVASKETTATDGIADRDAGITDEMTSAPVGQIHGRRQPFAPVAGAAPIRNSGIDNFQLPLPAPPLSRRAEHHQSLLAAFRFSLEPTILSYQLSSIPENPSVATETWIRVSTTDTT